MARRNQSTFLNDIFIIFSKLPWWLGLLFAPLSYVFISSYAVAPVFDSTNPMQHLSMALFISLRQFSSMSFLH